MSVFISVWLWLRGLHGYAFLQLCPEDDGEHGETDGSSQSQVGV